MIFLLFMSSCSTNTQQVIEAPTEKDTAEVYTVEIKQMKFVPDLITVQRGDRIVFVNRDIMAHDVTEFIKKEWTSGPLTTGQYWTLTATQSADYFCSIHQVMKGKIVVE
jgi:plastocyanin